MQPPTRSLLPAGPTKRFELAHGITIAADLHGDPAGPPVVFLHGGGQTRHSWGGTAERLGSLGFHAITMDHRGHGDSSWEPNGEYWLDGFVEDLLGVIDQLHDKPILVGASLGGITSLIAETMGEESIAKGLILVDITPRMDRDGVQRILAFMRGGADGFESLEEAAKAISSYLPHRSPPRDVSGLQKNLRLGDDGRYRWHWDPRLLNVWDTSNYDEEEGQRIVEERMAASRRLTIPTLLVRGRMSDVVTEEAAREFLAVVPHAEYVDLQGAAHMVAGDKNDAFTDAVIDFIGRRFAG